MHKRGIVFFFINSEGNPAVMIIKIKKKVRSESAQLVVTLTNGGNCFNPVGFNANQWC